MFGNRERWRGTRCLILYCLWETTILCTKTSYTYHCCHLKDAGFLGSNHTLTNECSCRHPRIPKGTAVSASASFTCKPQSKPCRSCMCFLFRSEMTTFETCNIPRGRLHLNWYNVPLENRKCGRSSTLPKGLSHFLRRTFTISQNSPAQASSSE